MPATLPQLLQSDCLHAPRPLGSPLATPTTRYSVAHIRPSLRHATSSPHCRRSQAPANSTSPADARSVPLRSSDVSCVIIKRLGPSDAAPASPIRLPARTAAPRLAPRKPHHPLQPRAQPPRPATHKIIHPHCRRSQAPANSTSPADGTQRTAEVQRRQLRHPSETRCQRRCPSCSDPIVCTRRRSSARPSQPPPPATASRAAASAHNTHHHRTAGGRNHPPAAQAQPMHAAYSRGPATSAAS